MIDTIEIVCDLKPKLAFSLSRVLCSVSYKNYRRDGVTATHFYETNTKFGTIMLTDKTNPMIPRKLYFNFRLANLITINPIALLSPSDINYFLYSFDQEAESIRPIFPKYNNFKIRRIDCAIDIPVINAGIYIYLIQRSKFYYRFNFCEKYSDSFYLKSSTKGVYINFYNKILQFENEHGYNPLSSYYDSLLIAPINYIYDNILRLEIQCKIEKIINILRKRDDTSRTIDNLVNPEISREILLYYINSTFGSNDFFSLNKAYDKIDMSNHRDNTKQEMKDFLYLINKEYSIQMIYEKSSNKSVFNRYKKLIEECGVNIFIIPDEFGYEELVNPVKLCHFLYNTEK